MKPAPIVAANTPMSATPWAKVAVRVVARTPSLELDAAEADGVPVTHPEDPEGAVAVPVTVAVATAGVPTAKDARVEQREEDPAG